MKINLLSLSIFAVALSLFSCDVYENRVIPSSNVTTRQATLSNYNAIDASNAFSVYVNFSDVEESIEIEANDNLHQYITVRKVNGTLMIEIEDHVHIRGNSTLNAFITTKSISRFSGSGATRFFVNDEINEEQVNIYLSGASIFNGDINSDQFFADLSGASMLNLSGTCNDFEVEASGASQLKDYTFSTDKLKADLSGASMVKLTVNDEIDVEASGASILRFKGDAVITHLDLSGASDVKKME